MPLAVTAPVPEITPPKVQTPQLKPSVPLSVTPPTIALLLASVSCPALMVVPPVYVFVPERTWFPPSTMRAPVPEMVPENVDDPAVTVSA